MGSIVSVQARLLMRRPWWRFWKLGHATPHDRRYASGGTHVPVEETRRQNMKLLSRKWVVDRKGRHWVIERRKCLQTGMVLKIERRITD